jgi:hypothetical protein
MACAILAAATACAQPAFSIERPIACGPSVQSCTGGRTPELPALSDGTPGACDPLVQSCAPHPVPVLAILYPPEYLKAVCHMPDMSNGPDNQNNAGSGECAAKTCTPYFKVPDPSQQY